MAKMKDFEGFRFGNIHSSDLDLVVVSSSNRYDKNLLPPPKDYTIDVPGGDGKYYFGQTFETRSFTVNVAFDNVSEPTFRKIAQLFACDKLQDLVFDELPYKTYRAKIKSNPDFKHICFTNRETGERVYKGEGTLQFICYFPYAFGFNKYVVRAADYYKCMMPEDIITNSIEENPYKRRGPKKMLPGLIKDHYNVRPNMNTPWKGGYPTIEQTQWGELYFTPPPSTDRPVIPQDCSDAPNNDNKLLIDVRGYWKNIPEWQGTAKLLTTPTLDYDQELIYLPQYSKKDYYNMDIGSAHNTNLMGSRILVYNPGDVPVEFELRIGNLIKQFRGRDPYTFRISRHNVQRLLIEDAVDWTGLTTFRDEDNIPYKYGNRYFTITEGVDNTKLVTSTEVDGQTINFYEPAYRNLKIAHPNHTYLIEPIPREKLGHFIRLFYWQSLQLNKDDPYVKQVIDFEQGKAMAARYEELYKGCITDEERYELYWKTLKDAILSRYLALDEALQEARAPLPRIFNDDYTYEDFVYDYIYSPAEYIRVKTNDNAKYGQFDLNINNYPQYITGDYFDINTKDFDQFIQDKDVKHQTIEPLFLDTDRRMLYNIIEPKWEKDNEELYDNFYDYKPHKNILNENIEKGHWFKLPPGWSLINITPVVDEDVWGGKRWLDARPFDWGWSENANYEEVQKKRQIYNTIYTELVKRHIEKYCPEYITTNTDEAFVRDDEGHEGELVYDNGQFTTDEMEQIEHIFQLRRWYEDYRREMLVLADFSKAAASFGDDIYKKRTEVTEVKFLRTLDEYWRNNFGVNPNEYFHGELSEWWWYANNYIWANFPPIYWGYIDLLNDIQIKYVPLFY